MMAGASNYPDPNDVQAEASDPTVSAWVTANAGSGKTKVLIDRVARLLLGSGEGPPPDPSNILCLTYTRAAAANMQNRLFERLGRWALLRDEDLTQKLAELFGETRPEKARQVDLASARRLFAQALETPGGLKIQTIHAFCESLLRRFPIEAGVSPHFRTLEEVDTVALIRQARDRVIADAFAEDADPTLHAAMERVLQGTQEYGLDPLCREIIARRSAFEGHREDLEASIYAALEITPQDTEESVTEAFHASVPVELIRRLADAFESGGTIETKFAHAAHTALEDEDREAWFSALKLAVLTKEGQNRAKFPTGPIREAHPWIEDEIRDLQERLRRLNRDLLAIRNAPNSVALLIVAQAFLAEFDRLKHALDALDFDDLIRRAGQLLNESDASAWVRYKLDGGVDHILVDEAQDTSPEQWRAVTAIADEFFAGEGARLAHRTLFVVGDDKQSIFSFQGAAPQELDRVRAHFRTLIDGADKEMREPEMLHSFRSAPAVLKAVDRVFAQSAAHAGLSTKGGAPAHVGSRQTAPGRVEFWPPLGPGKADEAPKWWMPVDATPPASPEFRLAKGLAVQIAEWIDTGAMLPAQGRPIRPGDILILVRRRNAFAVEMLRQLKKAGLPVAGADRMVLTDQLAVRDLLAVAKFALLPEDDLMLANVLRSPVIGFSEAQLEALANPRKGGLWAQLVSRRDENAAFADAHAQLAHLLSQVGFARPYEFFETVLTRFGARARLLGRLGQDAADPIDELLAGALDFEMNGTPSLEGFVARIERAQLEIKREMEQGRNEIRIMTVHGSKGLEANMVILPDICALPATANAPHVFPLEDGAGALWVPTAEETPGPAALRKEQDKTRRMEEYRRLLYVGMTRARDWLLVCGWHGARNPSAESWFNLMAPALAEETLERCPTPFTDADGAPVEGYVLQDSLPPVVAAAEAEDGFPEPEPLPSALAAPPPTEKSRPPIAPSRAAEGDPYQPPAAPAAFEDIDVPVSSAERGVELHRLLELCAGCDPAARVALLRHVDGTLAERVNAVLDAPGLAWVFGAGSLAEVPVAGPLAALGGREILGSVDRLVVGEAQVDVIDFKSGRPSAPDELPEAYLRQLALYCAAVSEIFPQHRVNGHLLWLDALRLDTVDDGTREAALERVRASI